MYIGNLSNGGNHNLILYCRRGPDVQKLRLTLILRGSGNFKLVATFGHRDLSLLGTKDFQNKAQKISHVTEKQTSQKLGILSEPGLLVDLKYSVVFFETKTDIKHFNYLFSHLHNIWYDYNNRSDTEIKGVHSTL